MKTIFLGDLSQNNGPANVNKSILKFSKCEFWDTKEKNFLKNFLKNFIKMLNSDVVIIGSNYRKNYYLFRVAHFLKKKTIYLLHGFSIVEAEVNNLKNKKQIIKMEKRILKKVDLILPVSKNYKDYILTQMPELETKIHFLTNGIDKNDYCVDKKENVDKSNNHEVIACGGNRFIKHNSNVAKSVNELNKEGAVCNLHIYGFMHENNEKITENEHVSINGLISRNDLFQKMSQSKLFVLNTQGESFGLSVLDALMCGCNVLISKNAGVCSILELRETDIINNFNDIEEIKNKIKYNLKYDNKDRILKSIDFEHYSWKNVAQRLDEIAERLFNNKDYRDII